MSVINLIDQDKGIDLLMGTVIAQRERNGIISHIAILNRNVSDVKYNDTLPVYQMSPPLTNSFQSTSPEIENDPVSWSRIDAGDDGSSSTACVEVIARLEDLSEYERRKMGRRFRIISALFSETVHPIPKPKFPSASISEWVKFFTSCHYIAHPPIREEYDCVTKRIKNLWFSCAGFVIYLYERSKAVGKLLVSYSEPSFPTVDQEIIQDTWFGHGRKLPQEILSTLGLLGDGRWPVVMPGYVVNAFKRENDIIRSTPYFPKEEDIFVS